LLQKYYNILGLTKSANQAEIKRAYRKLALKFHPDTNSGNEVKFLEIAEAYQVLIGKKKPSPLNFNPTNNEEDEKIFVRRYNKWMTKTEYQNLVKVTQDHHKQKIREEKEENEKEFDELKKSKTYKRFKYSAILGVVFSVLLMVDYYVNPTLKQGVITHIETVTINKEDPYRGVTYQINESYITVNHNNNSTSLIRLNTNVNDFLKEGKNVEVIRSYVFNLNMGIKDEFLTYSTERRRFKGFHWFLVLFCSILIVITPIVEAPTPVYYMMLHLSTYGIPIILSCFILYVLLY
jgi:hypothetical protein